MRARVNAAVVALIVIVLLGLVLAGVQRVRDAAARAECENNLRAVGHALINYREAIGHYPPAVVQRTTLPFERRLGWLWELDPFIHARMDPDWHRSKEKPWDSEENLALARGRMFWLNCPGHPEGPTRDGLALSHFVGIAGFGTDAASLKAGDPDCGFFGYERTLKPFDIRDGLSNTLVAIETTRNNGPFIAGGPHTVRGIVLNNPPQFGVGGQFGGCHPRGTMALFGDVSVRFVDNSIGHNALQALATIAGGDEPGPFDFE